MFDLQEKSLLSHSSSKAKLKLETLPTDLNVRGNPNHLRAAPQPEEVVDHKFAQAEAQEPSEEPNSVGVPNIFCLPELPARSELSEAFESSSERLRRIEPSQPAEAAL